MRATKAQVQETRRRLHKAFTALRRQGFVARSNFMCCGGCASGAISQMAEERGKKAVVYWHSQDEERFRTSGKVWLGYGGLDDEGESARGILALEVGARIVVALGNAGLAVEWDADPSKRIHVIGLAG